MDYFDQKFEQMDRLAELFELLPDLFEPINLQDYASGSALENLYEDAVTEWGEKGWISFDKPDDDEEGGFQTYRFRWSDVGMQPITRPTDIPPNLDRVVSDAGGFCRDS